MSIYRGPGGAGDATNDASNQAVLAVESATLAETYKNQAQASAVSAAASAAAAEAAAESAAESAGGGAAGALLAANNLSDLVSSSTARTNLGLGTAATTAASSYATASQGTNADTAFSWGNHASIGYLTAVTGTSPVSVTTGTTTPVISMAKATASVNGYLASADFATFVSKQNAYLNLSTIGALANGTGWLYNNGSGSFSYTTPTAANVGAVPTSRTVNTSAPLTGGGALSSNLVLSMPQANATDDGYLSATDWDSFNSKVSSPWSQSGPDVFYTGGPVGIGTTNPLALLQIQNTSGDSSLSVINTGTETTDNAYCKLSAGLYEIQSVVYANGSANILTPCILTFGTNALTPISIQTNGVTRMYFDSVGRVGIGTTAQTEQLEVVGNVKATSFIGLGTSLTGTATSLSIGGNAETVTNGVYTTGSYADPAWITSLAGSKISGTIDGGSF